MKKLFLDMSMAPTEFVGEAYDEPGWHVVGSYNEFVAYILENGVPDLISFGHDLHDEHYDVDWWDFYKNGLLVPTTKPTGYDCAKWLYRFCVETRTELPKALVHAMNPVGREALTDYVGKWGWD